MGVTFHIGGGYRHGRRHHHEVKTPQGKRNFCIVVVLFLSLFVVVLSLALAFFIKGVVDSNGYHYTSEELVGTEATTYKIVIKGDMPKEPPTKFAVKFKMLREDDTPWTKETTSYSSEEDDKKVEYVVSIVIPKEEWLSNIDTVSAVFIYFGEEKIKATNQDAGGFILAISVISLFLIIIIGLIVYNFKSAIKYAKQAREEKQNPLAKRSESESYPQAKTESSQASAKIKCPYCGTVNSSTSVQCSNCKAPLM